MYQSTWCGSICRIMLLTAIFILLAVVIPVFLGGCEQSTSTGPDDFSSQLEARRDLPLSSSDTSGGSPNSPTTRDEGPSKEASGKLVLSEGYAKCQQSTNYSLVKLAVFLVHPDRGQSPVEGSPFDGAADLTRFCNDGRTYQLDCTVRDPDPQAGHIRPGDLFAFYIGEIMCSVSPPKPPETPPEEPPRCEPPDVSSLPELICTWNYETCQFDCVPFCEVHPNDETCQPEVCEPEGEPQCEEQDWNTEQCEWVGECGEPEPECTEQDEELWHNVAEAQCEYGIDDFVFDYESCGAQFTCNEPEPEPEHGECFYEVGGNKDLKELLCEANGGDYEAHDGSFKCRFDFPGISHSKFNLSPGLSDPDCLRKQDD